MTETAKGHGRIEIRSTIWVADATGLHDFPHLSQVIRIMREVDDAKTKTAYAVTSCDKEKANRCQLLTAARGHWSIENGLHWVRDATMREDHSKVRSGSAPRALAATRNLVISGGCGWPVRPTSPGRCARCPGAPSRRSRCSACSARPHPGPSRIRRPHLRALVPATSSRSSPSRSAGRPQRTSVPAAARSVAR